MNLPLLIPLMVTTVVAVSSWFVGHSLSTTRDRLNKKHDQRILFVLYAYRRLEAGTCRGSLDGTTFATGFQSAIADIQLLGTAEQIRLTKDMVTSIARREPEASAGPLLLSLRDALREHLGLESLGEEPLHFRLTFKGKSCT